ncbi:hypothetical protein Tco_1324473, partial [Tanacetum coccineum]
GTGTAGVVHKVLQEPDWELALNLSVQSSERVIKRTKDSEKGKIGLLIMYQLIWVFVLTSVNEGSVLGVTSSSNSFCPQKHRSLGKYQHCPSSFHKSTVPSFDNAVLLRSPRN